MNDKQNIYKKFFETAKDYIPDLTPDMQMTVTDFMQILGRVLDVELDKIDSRIKDIEKRR